MPKRRQSRSGSAKAARPLPNAELDVLACLWQRGPATVRQVREAIADYRPMTHGSMVTLLKRLEAKGWVSRKKGTVGKAFIYRAARKPGPTQRRILGDLVRRIFGGNGVALVSSLFETAPPAAEELDRLQQLLDTLRSRTGKGRRGDG